MRPDRTEVIDQRYYQYRLQQLGALYLPEKSQPNKQIFYSSRLRSWIMATPKGRSRIHLGFYSQGCPCG